MLRRTDIDHILRAAASLSGHSRFVMVGTGAVIAIAKLCAWRDKDQVWLREAFRSGVAKAPEAATLLHGELPETAPARGELIRRMNLVSPIGGKPSVADGEAP
ncbi:MAG: hypothetical protein ABSE20_22215 [Acetobacteraceae bacterium]|jgi:hypothetical protein